MAVAVDAREAGGLEPAREYVGVALASLKGLELSDAEEVLKAVEELDGVAKTLGMLEMQLEAREWVLAAGHRRAR